MWKSALAALVLAAGCLSAQADSRWAPFEFMIGKWKAQTGDFTFLPDLGARVLVRRSANPAAKHEDLMIVYLEEGPKAIYWDNEGHVIRYNVSFPAPNAAAFESTGAGPKYRLSYSLNGKQLDGKFEIDGKTYLQWTTTKE